MKKLEKEAALLELAEDIPEFSEEVARSAVPQHWERWKAGWRPRLNHTQKLAKASTAMYKLLDGPRGSGKSIGALHELVEHAYLNPDALTMVLVREVGMGTHGGAWHKLLHDVLPIWRDGNIHPLNIKKNGKWERNPLYGQKSDEGLGIQFKEGFDAQTHRPLIWIQNRFGGWSKVILISLPVDSHVQNKIKGSEPSFIFVDEAQTLETDGYFKFLVQQLGRVARCLTQQTIIYACNPDGPSHWLYKRFFIIPVNEETGEWNPKYARFHVPVAENEENLPIGYYENLREAVKGDPIEEARNLRGEWIDRPEGNALFAASFIESEHMIGDAAKNQGLKPVPRVPVIVSYDLGAAHSSIHFKQIVPTVEKLWKLVLDEMNYVGQYMRYSSLVPKLIQRMQYLEDLNGGPIKWVHISDNSAFNQYRARDGSFDAWDVENLSRGYVEKHNLDPRFIIKMLECPKGPGSIAARVRLLRDYMENDEIRYSATCVKTKQMLLRLEEDPRKPYHPKETSPFVHPFDSLTYGFFYYDKGRIRQPVVEDRIKPMVYHVGRAA